MSSGRGRPPYDTDPLELRLDVIVLARWPLPRDGTTEMVALAGRSVPVGRSGAAPTYRRIGACYSATGVAT